VCLLSYRKKKTTTTTQTKSQLQETTTKKKAKNLGLFLPTFLFGEYLLIARMI
jgi:hypothetical protein